MSQLENQVTISREFLENLKIYRPINLHIPNAVIEIPTLPPYPMFDCSYYNSPNTPYKKDNFVIGFLKSMWDFFTEEIWELTIIFFVCLGFGFLIFLIQLIGLLIIYRP